MTTGVKVFVYGLLALLCIPALVGFDVWPLTGWRLFSLSRDATQIEWALDARTPTGLIHVDLEQLPLAFRNAAWPLAHLPKASASRKAAVCDALLDGIRTSIPPNCRSVCVTCC